MTVSHTPLKWIVLAAIVAVMCAGPAFGADAEAGKAVFMRKCKTCHGADGTGNAGMAKVLKVEIKNLASEEVQAKSDGEIKTAINEGFGKMKPVKGLTATNVDDIIAFVRTLAKK